MMTNGFLLRCGLLAALLLVGCAGEPHAPRAPLPLVVPDVAAPAAVPAARSAVEPPASGQGGHPALLPQPDGRAAASASTPPDPPAPARTAPVPAVPPGLQVAYLLQDVASGEVLAAQAADLPLPPASTAKLATAVVALDLLGPEHRFVTELLASGPVRDGVLEGDLILRGHGDPVLDAADLLELAVQLAVRGVERVAGRFVIDDTALPVLPEIAPGQPEEAGYNAGIGALSVAFNRVRVAWQGGAPPAIRTLPPLQEARFETVPPAALPPSGAALAPEDGNGLRWQLAERGRRWQAIDLPVKDPGLHAGEVFRWLAAMQGITLPPPRRERAPAISLRLAAHSSPPLRRLVRDMLIYSNNMMAETIGLAASSALAGPPADLAASSAGTLAHLRRLLPEVDWRGAQLNNHSGLDSDARLSARQLAAVARYGWYRHDLPGLLPAGGWSGTLAGRFKDEASAMRIWAKTGTMNYNAALAGFAFPEAGRPAVLVTLVADVGRRAAYDALERPSARDEAAADAWNARALRLQDGLVEGWLGIAPSS